MSYLQQEGLSKRQVYGIVFVGILHVFLAYAFISGLAIKAVRVITGPMETVNIEEPPPKTEEPPPPPPKLEDIPPYVPPPDVQVQTEAAPPPTITTQTAVPTPAPVAAPAPPAPPAPPPAPKGPTTPAQPNPRTLATSQDDYPGASLRAEEEGVTRVEVIVNTEGRVSACSVVKSSGFQRLDEATCKIAERRWRFKPAVTDGQPVDSRYQQNVRWQITGR
jgi:protein TonB